MDISDVVANARDAMTVRRVFGDPYENHGVVVIPAAHVRGGAGGGDGSSDTGEGRGAGSGTGFGLSVRPAGAFVVQGGDVKWKPAIDVNRIVLGGQVVAVVALLVVRAIVRARAR